MWKNLNGIPRTQVSKATGLPWKERTRYSK